ncbi:MAG: GFA family protein [Proteobacteria bacterium]|nr:GFA family protein [Pseudomonadota bacterium]
MPHVNITGGCLCGALRYEAGTQTTVMGYCCCDDCQKVSGSGFIPFIRLPPGALKVSGEYRLNLKQQADGRNSDRYHCVKCASLVFGGAPGNPNGNTLYAGTLDDTAIFQPAMAIMTKFKPDWVLLPDGLKMFEGMPQ